MRRALPPVEMIREVAKLLGELREDVAFLGGAVVGLLVTDPAAREPRPTQDVDVVVEVASRLEYNQLEDRLRALGFVNVMEGPVCRFQHNDVILDVMPTLQEVLGFGNKWYTPALENSAWMDLGGGTTGRVITAPYFLATKFGAFESPDREGHGDYMASRDFEDIVTVVDGRPGVIEEVSQAEPDLKAYLSERMTEHSESPYFEEGVAAHLDIDTASQKRATAVVAMLRSLIQVD